MHLSYIHESPPKIDRRSSLVVVSLALGLTFALRTFPSFTVGLMAAIVLLAGVYRMPELGIAILVTGLHLVGFFWRGVQLPYLITPLAVLLSSMGLAHYIVNNGLRWHSGALPRLVVLMGLALLIGTSYSPTPSVGLFKLGKYLSNNLYIFFAIMLFTNDLNRLKNLIKAVAFTGMVGATVSVLYIALAGHGDVVRFALPEQNPIWFARGMGMSLFATLFLLDWTKTRAEKTLYLCFVPIMLYLVYAAGSRGPAVALLITLLVYFFLIRRKRLGLLRRISSVLLILMLIGLSVAVAPEAIWERMANLFSGFDITTFYRLRAFETAKELFCENPLLGVGTGGFGHFNMLSYPHNIFLEFASELGILGLSLVVIFVIYSAYIAIRLLATGGEYMLKTRLSEVYVALFIFSLVNSQFSGAVWGNHELWFSVAGMWVLHASKEGIP